MAHMTRGGFSPSSEIRLRIPSPDGGVYFCDSSASLPDGKCPELLNMWSCDGILKTRPGQSHPFSGFTLPEFGEEDAVFTEEDVAAAGGSFHGASKRSFYGSSVYHLGRFLIAFDGKSKPRVIYGGAPDCDSFFCEIGSKLYLYTSDEHILSVDRDFAVTECVPYTPTVITDAQPNLKTYTANEPLNLMSRRIKIVYVSFASSRSLKLPYPADMSCGFKVVFDGEREADYESIFFANESTISIPGTLTGDTLEITYTVKRDSTACRTDMIFGCTFAECYGGTTVEGTRIFLSGNPDYPGYYFRSELLNPFYFKETAFDIIGNGNDRVTAFSKQYGGLIVFTEKSIARIIYSFGESGADFSVREINSRIGCDMSGSVALIDNRTVFASSSGGVYIIDSTDNEDEMNVVPISECILGSDTAGLRAESDKDKAACRSIDFAGKYYLFIGGRAYIWDYTATPYYSGISMKDFGKKFAWYVFDGMRVSDVSEIGGSLWFIREGEALPTLFSEKNGDDFGNPIHSHFRTKEYDIGTPSLYKRASRMAMSLTAMGSAVVSLRLFCDGKRIIEYPTDVGRFSWDTFGYGKFTWDSGFFKRRLIRTPSDKGIRFSAGAESEGGIFGVADIEIIFKKQV